MEVTIFVALFAFAVVLLVLFHKLPTDMVSISHGARVQRIGLGLLNVMVWFALALLSSSIDYYYVSSGSMAVYTVQTIYFTAIFFGVGIYFLLMTFLTFLEHVSEEVTPEEEMAGVDQAGNLLGGD
jgi:heme/copper-type cytochrome/quinol oxidase subunit 3